MRAILVDVRGRRVCIGIVAAMLLLAAASGAASARAGAHHHHAKAHAKKHAKSKRRAKHSPGVRTIPVSFSVVNDNKTNVACLPVTPDGKTYTISGSLILPARQVPAGVTLYAHGLGYARFFWDFKAVPGYDYAGTEATDGHASVIIDRLGYGKSSIPSGTVTCVGSQATILHEIVQDLRTGDYTAQGLTAAPSFSRIGLVGHSAGGELVEIEAWSFKDIDALGVMDWADQFYSVGAYAAFGEDTVSCLTGGIKQVGSSSAGYAAFGQTTAQFDSLMFADIDPAVANAVNAIRTHDPCGLIETILNGTAYDLLPGGIGSIKVPIAYVHGADDGVFQAGLPWPTLQQALYTGSSKVTNITLAGAGHAVTLERDAPQLESAMNAWLTSNHL